MANLLNKKNFKKILVTILFFFGAGLFAQMGSDALKLYNSGQYKGAIEVCLNEIKSNDKNLNSYVVLVWSLISDRQYNEALYWCVASKAVSKYDPRILFSEGEANFFLSKNLQAIKSFEKYIVYAPNGNKLSYVYYYLGEIYLRLKKFYHADIAFSTAVQFNPRVANWWARLGYAREQSADYAFALQAYQKALNLDKNLQDAQIGKMRVLKRL